MNKSCCKRRNFLVGKLLLVLLFASSGVIAQEPFKLRDLVIKQSVSYTLGPVTLTRVLENTTSRNSSGTTSSSSQSSGSSENISGSVSSGTGRTSRNSSSVGVGGSIGGSTGGSGNFSLTELLGINLDVGGKVTSESSSEFSDSSRSNYEVSAQSSRSSSSGSTSESADLEQYGDYHLMFSVIFKSNDSNDRFSVGGAKSRVILNGFSRSVEVPYLARQDPVLLQVGEPLECFFDYPIKDQVLLQDAKSMVSQGRRSAVTLTLNGNLFPVVSERTGENVISTIARLTQSENTEISVDFGEVKPLSPWRVKQKFPRSYRKNDQRVTVREAIEALNAVIADNEDFSETAFAIDKNGAISAIENTPAVYKTEHDDISIIAVNCVRKSSDADTEIHLPTSKLMSRHLSDFSELHFVELSLKELAQIHSVQPASVASLVEEVQSVLPAIDGGKQRWEDFCKKFERKDSAQMENGDKSGNQIVSGVHKVGDEMSIDLSPREIMHFCYCPRGKFLMGSPRTDDPRDDDEILHEVTLSRGFWMGRTEVTQGQWREIMGTTVYDQAKKMLYDETVYDFGSSGKKTIRERLGFDRYQDPKLCCAEADDDVPVYYVNYEEAKEFCVRLTERERKAGRLPRGWSYRLPTEAEWEYACRAGIDTPLPNGKRLDAKGQCNAPNLSDIAWYSGNSMLGFTGRSPWNSSNWPEMENQGGPCGPRRVAMKTANNWGLYDMIGNVWEWCLDWYGDYPDSSMTDPHGRASGVIRVYRGGGWFSDARFCRSALRGRSNPGFRNYVLGFRVCCSVGSYD